MPSFTAGQVERCLLRKLRSVERQGGNHRLFEVLDDQERVVATTLLSRSWRRATTLDAGLVSAIRRQLGLRAHAEEFAGLIECVLTRNDYMALVESEIIVS